MGGRERGKDGMPYERENTRTGREKSFHSFVSMELGIDYFQRMETTVIKLSSGLPILRPDRPPVHNDLVLQQPRPLNQNRRPASEASPPSRGY